MKDTTSTPKDPDGRAGVTSGRQAGSGEPSSGAAAAPERAPSPAGSDGGPAEQIAAKPDRAAPDRGGADRDGAAAPAGDNGRASVPASSNDPSPSRGTPEAPTAKIRLPQDGNGAAAASEQPTVTGVRPADLAKPGASSGSTGSQAGRSAPPGGAGSSSAKSSAAGPTAPDSTARGSTAAGKPTAATKGKAIPGQATPSEPGPPGPSPASGPVPTPGPGAASPPPWNRLPGQAAAAQDSAAATSPPAASGPMSGLIGDGPTAYLLPDSNASAVATDTQPTGRGPLRSGSGRPRPPRQAALQLKRLDPW
ncbi:MAG TPA: hypothetical protein VNP92_05840, partial [Actinophytocola sp.]|nr:hypothetical protein [Actinophytocola sp.]